MKVRFDKESLKAKGNQISAKWKHKLENRRAESKRMIE